jgi:hypothetical protein
MVSDLGRLGRILFAGEFDPRLDLTDGDTGEIQIGIVNTLELGEYGAMGTRPAQFGHHVGVEQEGHGLQSRHGPPGCSASRGHEGFAASLGGQQQVFEVGPCGCLEAIPLLDRHQHGGFCATAGDHLGAFPLADIKQLSEARLGVLHGPDRHGVLLSD